MNIQNYRFIGDAGFCGFSKERSRGFVVAAFEEISEVCNLRFEEGYGGLVIQWVPYIGGKEKDYMGCVTDDVLNPSSTRMVKSHWIRHPRVFPSLIHSLLLTRYRFGLYPANRSFNRDDSPSWLTPMQVDFLQTMWGKPSVFWPKELLVAGRYLRSLKSTRDRMIINREWAASVQESDDWHENVCFFNEKIENVSNKWHWIWDRWRDTGLVRMNLLDY